MDRLTLEDLRRLDEKERLGRRMFSQNVVLRGKLSNIAWRAFIRDVLKALGMTSAGAPAVWHYPTDGGEGGLGSTICQPMTESFIVLDTWPDHDGAYLHISSCKEFDPSKLISPVHKAGLTIDSVGALEALRL